MTKTSVVVVAYRSLEHLEHGLPPLLADPAVGDVVVVDNSQDPATELLVGRFQGRVVYVDPGENLGFAKACNLGARLTHDPVLTFLNPDVVLTRGLADLVEGSVREPTSIRAGGLTSGDDPERLVNARYRVTLVRELRRVVLGSGSSLQQTPAGHTSTAVDQVDGALLMVGRDFFDRLGGFDERFELYFEDVDLCDRGRAEGSVVLDTQPYGVHAAGASARKAAAAAYYAFRVSRIRYFTKQAGVAGAVLAFALTLVEGLVRSATRQPEGAAVRLRAMRLTWAEVMRPGTVQVLE